MSTAGVACARSFICRRYFRRIDQSFTPPRRVSLGAGRPPRHRRTRRGLHSRLVALRTVGILRLPLSRAEHTRSPTARFSSHISQRDAGLAVRLASKLFHAAAAIKYSHRPATTACGSVDGEASCATGWRQQQQQQDEHTLQAQHLIVPIGLQQAGQDRYVYDQFVNVPNALLRCSGGVFVEFGARNGIEHSNTYFFEKVLGWKGLLFEADPKEHLCFGETAQSDLLRGCRLPAWAAQRQLCRIQDSGWSGPSQSYEPTRYSHTERVQQVKCFDLAQELIRRNWTTVDYMTIDVEGHEAAIVEDFPWRSFRIKLVQVEQLDERNFPAQKGRKDRIIKHMRSNGYALTKVYTVAPMDTEDLIFSLRDWKFCKLTRRHKSECAGPCYCFVGSWDGTWRSRLGSPRCGFYFHSNVLYLAC